ncbi:MAG: inner-rane translocator [Ilumatobacteraceae bacterium]|nr:inner-rane translocator [Ilumatobacteraceae bacterium]
MLTLDLALAGLGVGAIAALSGLGLLATYRLTGVLNLAFGAVGMIVAFLLWQEVRVWHWPTAPAAVLDLVVVCPAFGTLLERLVFRPLQQRRAAAAERLVASLGLLVVILGVATVLWGAQARLDAPLLVPSGNIELPGRAHIAIGTVVELVVILIVGAALGLGQRTHFGLRVRAVVENRSLAELGGIDADRIAAIGWAIGTTLAGLCGILLAPTLRLEPYGLTLVLLETMAVVVIARLSSPLLAVVGGLVLGIVQAELTRLHATGTAQSLLQALTSNLLVVALLVATLVVGRLAGSGGSGGTDAGATAGLTSRGELPPVRGWWVIPAVTLGAPLLFGADNMHTALTVPALAIVLVSIVVVSGYGGQISLGQAGFAGLGALITARLADGSMPLLPRVPGVGALIVCPLIVFPLGMLCGWPAIRRRGLFLAITTFALSVAMSRFLFEQPAVTQGVHIEPPATFASDNNFYVLELACLGVAFAIVHNLHRGRLGRALIAVRDDEGGAHASGVDVRRLKLLMFGASAAMAALGGALLAMGSRAFDTSAFDPIRGLIWFAAVVVFGIDNAVGAVIGAALLVAFDAGLPLGTSTLVIGAAALLIGRLPGGLLHGVRRLTQHVTAGRGVAADVAPRRLTPRGRQLAIALQHRSTDRGVAP